MAKRYEKKRTRCLYTYAAHTHIDVIAYMLCSIYVITEYRTSFTFIVYEREKDRQKSIFLKVDLFNT